MAVKNLVPNYEAAWSDADDYCYAWTPVAGAQKRPVIDKEKCSYAAFVPFIVRLSV